MKNKKAYALIFLILILIGITIGITTLLRSSKNTTEEMRILELLNGIKTYRSSITIEVKNQRNNIKYEGTQVYKKNLGYKLVLNDSRTFIFKGDDIAVKDEESTRAYTLDKSFDEVFKYGFVGEFISLVYTNEELKFEKETIDGKEYYVITTLIPGSNNNIFKGKMYYSIEDYAPKKILILDINNEERVIFTYKNFNWTDKVEDVELDF